MSSIFCYPVQGDSGGPVFVEEGDHFVLTGEEEGGGSIAVAGKDDSILAGYGKYQRWGPHTTHILSGTEGIHVRRTGSVQ
jgi:hypothetical protein